MSSLDENTIFLEIERLEHKVTPACASVNISFLPYSPTTLKVDVSGIWPFYKHPLNNNILHKKQFRFQENHSTDHTIIQLDFSKVFDIVNYVIMIKKLDHYDAKRRNLS